MLGVSQYIYLNCILLKRFSSSASSNPFMYHEKTYLLIQHSFFPHLGCQELNSGPYACWTSTLPLRYILNSSTPLALVQNYKGITVSFLQLFESYFVLVVCYTNSKIPVNKVLQMFLLLRIKLQKVSFFLCLNRVTNISLSDMQNLLLESF